MDNKVKKGVFRPLRPGPVIFVLVLFVFTVNWLPGKKGYVRFAGQTMGTYYRITARFPDEKWLQTLTDERLESVNGVFSVFRPDSEVSRFNNHFSLEPFAVSTELFNLVQVSQKVSLASSGAYDVTVNQLLQLWGFRPGGEFKKPVEEEIERVMGFTGYEKLRLLSGNYLQKTVPGLQIDLGSIAKGYGVDVVAELFEEKGIEDYLVEIGGEIRTRGLSPAGKNWRIGINTPEKTAALDEIFAIVEVSDRAVATSGNYRNYIESGDESWAHIMEPRKGRPVLGDVLSSTVLADDCLTADALATAAIVSGREAAVLLFEKFPVEWYLIFRDKNGGLNSVHSDGFVLQEVSK